jgi:hypothetical protein
LIPLLIVGCASSPERPETPRQALFGLSQRAASRLIEMSPLPHPPSDQVLLLSISEVAPGFGFGTQRVQESLMRALLGLSNGPQVLDWAGTIGEGAKDNQWRLDSRLEADGPRLTLSDRTLLPYRLSLTLRRPGSDAPLWAHEIQGAFDATAL